MTHDAACEREEKITSNMGTIMSPCRCAERALAQVDAALLAALEDQIEPTGDHQTLRCLLCGKTGLLNATVPFPHTINCAYMEHAEAITAARQRQDGRG